jgi:hypothetical protein
VAGLLLSLLLLGSSAPSQTPDRLAEAERYIEGEDYPAAARILNDLALARIQPGLVPDPLLSGLQGRLLARRAPPTIALAYLQFADSEAVPLAQRVAALFALAETREAAGDRLRAGDAYRRLQGLKLSDREQWRARLGDARSRLPDAPREATAAARELAASAVPTESWEAELLLAEASLLLGDRAGDREAADRAWAGSAEAPPAQFAPQRIATFRAALAAAEGRRAGIIAALTAAGSSRKIDPAIVESLPVCVAGKLEPDDWVTFTAFADVENGRWLAPVSASRPAAVIPLTDAVAGLSLFADGAGTEITGGLIFTLRCRTAPSARYRRPARDADPLPSWFASRGLLLPLIGRDLADINRLSGQVEDLAREHPEDPKLIPMRIALAGALRARTATASDVEPWQVAQHEKLAREAMLRIGGTEVFPFELADIWTKPPQDESEIAALLARTGPAMSAYIGRAPLDLAYEMALRAFGNDLPFGAALRRSTIEALSKRFADRRDDPRRTSLLLMLAEMQRDDPASRRSRWRATGLPLDLCGAGDEPPTLTEHHIDDGDFPKDLLRFALTGYTAFDMTVTAGGRAKDGRIILAVPTGLFDPVLIPKLVNFEMKPMQTGGQARECRGYTQRVVWTFPEGDSNPLPNLAMPGTPTF